MERINLKKYGFVRSCEDDFSDDGNKFNCYKLPDAPNIRISKHVYNGELYLSGRIQGIELSFDEYRKLPHYKLVTWDYNPRLISRLSDEDLFTFSNAVKELQKEAEEALKNAYIPTREDIIKKFIEEKNEAIDYQADILEVYEDIKKLLFDPSVSLENVKYFDKNYYFERALKYFKNAVNEVESILRRDKEQFIQEMLAQPRTQQLYYINKVITRSRYNINNCKEYLEKIIKS